MTHSLENKNQIALIKKNTKQLTSFCGVCLIFCYIVLHLSFVQHLVFLKVALQSLLTATSSYYKS